MRNPAKTLYVIVGLLYFPIGTILAWYAYRDVIRFEKRCQYDKAERKLENDGIVMFGLVAVWIVAVVFLTNLNG